MRNTSFARGKLCLLLAIAVNSHFKHFQKIISHAIQKPSPLSDFQFYPIYAVTVRPSDSK